jgi:hypothetical protein
MIDTGDSDMSKAEERTWPSLEEQLRDYNVSEDSPLGRLIQESQEFELLQPEELDDSIPLPPWLRIHWRTQNPNFGYSADYPLGGYPSGLRHLHDWILTHPDLEPGPEPEPSHDPPLSSPGGEGDDSGLGTVTTVSASPEAAALIGTVGSNRRISGAQVVPRTESDIRVNFFDPKLIIAAANAGDGDRQAQFYSRDRGNTWGQSTLPLVQGDLFHLDPAVDWTSDGTAWAVTMGISMSAIRLRAYKSSDGGKTWAFDGDASGTQTLTEKEKMWTDHSAQSPHQDNIYVLWSNNHRVFVNRRTGPAGSWQTPIQVSGAETTFGVKGDITTNSSGDVFAMWTDYFGNYLFVSRSFDGGRTFSSPVLIAKTFAGYSVEVPAVTGGSVPPGRGRHPSVYLSAGAYETSTRDFAYAVWMDLTGDSGCNAPGHGPGNNVSSTCKTRIWFSRSAPRRGQAGASWQTPIMINNHPALSDQFSPRLAVDPKDGTIGVIYYDTVRDTGRLKTDVWFQSSSDHGVTWSKPVRVTTAQTDETSAGADFLLQYGDFNGLTSYGGRFWPSWTDRRNGLREEIWTAVIKMEEDEDE